MAPFDLEVFITPELGDASYLIASGDEAALVDPQRDAWRFLAVAERLGWRVRHVLETHVHNDYVSGAHEVRAATGAELVVPARGGYTFAHTPADEGTELRLGDVTLTARATPGHTPEHLAWEVGGAEAGDRDAGAPLAVFSGGSLLVGSSGRTDLLGEARAAELTPAQFRTLRRLAELPDVTQVLPTHGAGSFCSAGPPASDRTTTIGAERWSNAAFGASSLADFETIALGSLGRYPAYYDRMAPLNRAGVPVLGRLPDVPALDPAAVDAAVRAGATIIDARSRAAFARAHIPGSLNVELSSPLSGYVGWLLPFDSPVILNGAAEPDIREAVTQLFRIGWSAIRGTVAGGVDGWAASGREVKSYEEITLEDLRAEIASGAKPKVLDVRQPVEWRDGTIPGSDTIFVSDLPLRLAELDADDQLTIVCKSGQRSAIAASLLDGAGVNVRFVGVGGVPDWDRPQA
jgi:glyoxylase-like metal-dependent hydrolase (beta-lactamase superfamily II)/rhodanese-related sulfurtransferase